MDFYWKPYVSVAERRARAQRELTARKKRGGPAPAPVEIVGRAIASTFWGRSWCDNLERYSDYASRLPRGRSYVRNGSVVDLRLETGRVTALVSGSELYEIEIEVAAVAPARWAAVRSDCAGAIDSLVELLQGRLSDRTMERICAKGTGLFPEPKELSFSCSCPDWASMCKHVAATLYGVGARLDREPALLFTLRGVDAAELVAAAGDGLAKPRRRGTSSKILEGASLSAMFGLELDEAPAPARTRTPVKASANTKATSSKQAKPAARSKPTAPPRKKPARRVRR